MGQSLLCNQVFRNAMGAYREYENQKVKEILGKNYKDYLILTKQLPQGAEQQEESKRDRMESNMSG